MLKLFEVSLITAIIFMLSAVNCRAESEKDYISMTTAAAQAESYRLYETILNSHRHDKFKVGYLKGTSFIYEDIPNHKSGYGYDYMEYLSNYANCRFEYVEFESWDELVKKFQSGEIDIMPDMPGDYKKIQNAKRTDHVVGRYPMEKRWMHCAFLILLLPCRKKPDHSRGRCKHLVSAPIRVRAGRHRSGTVQDVSDALPARPQPGRLYKKTDEYLGV